MNIDTAKFGTIEVDDSSIIEMPRGLLGFENYRRYCVIQQEPDTPFKWLQSVDRADLAFVVVDPSQFFADYEVEVSDPDVEFLGIQEADEAVIMTLVTIGEDRGVTTNLLGPIVVNARTLVGMQIVLGNENYRTKHQIGHMAQSINQTERPLAKAA